LPREAEHVTTDGKYLLAMHGNEVDSMACYAKFVALLCDWAYGGALTGINGSTRIRDVWIIRIGRCRPKQIPIG
jgi:hypothetical protein